MQRKLLNGGWVFPAHAGMSRVTLANVALKVSFPRSRGDEPSGLSAYLQVILFSPLTRG